MTTGKKRLFRAFLAFIMIFAMMFTMAACGNKEKEEEAAEDAAMTQEVEQGPEAVKTIDEIDVEGEEPLQIESITLFEDGSVLVVPTDDLRKNEMKDDEDGEGIYPFADSGKVKDIYIFKYGDEGERTILALLEDGTISAVNGSALVKDHIIAVMNTVAGRDNFVSVENVSDDSGTRIVAYTEDGEDVVLDYSLDFSE